MADVTGAVRMKANGKEFQLWMGTSVLAALQGLHGNDVLQQLEEPDGAPKGWMPNLAIMVDLFRLSLERFHPDDADRWTADDLISQNSGAFQTLMAGSLPDPAGTAQGNAPAPKRRAR